MTIAEAAGALRARRISSVELTKECLDQIGKLNPVLNAFITVTGETALFAARPVLCGNPTKPALNVRWLTQNDVTASYNYPSRFMHSGSELLETCIPDGGFEIGTRELQGGRVGPRPRLRLTLQPISLSSGKRKLKCH